MQIENCWQKILADNLVNQGHPLHYLAVTESTNTVAMELCRKGATGGTIVLTETQTMGRGRLSGRKWLSPKGCGLYLSIILYPNLSPADYPKITLATGVAVCKALTAETSAPVKLKWPNDLLINDKKCGGILTETGPFSATGPTPVIIGIGINVGTGAEDFSGELAATATSLLLATGKRYDRGVLLRSIITEIDIVITCLEQEGFRNVLQDWQRLDAYRDRTVTWVNSRGEMVSGISMGPDEDGLLHIRDQKSEIHAIISGDINLARR
ncbi:MAG: biotin--[acetyl-CoA-carboxylase] ligase [Desulfobulbaceae bacterium]|nr:biotin--[acetyl-CoA-carboxylase] ligase [Desulfobulbaceae bacterium]HIJ79005.1 biotin--[acetyl-CoA-carboxylase] ligase [Deltaproteobacteria bacterium]